LQNLAKADNGNDKDSGDVVKDTSLLSGNASSQKKVIQAVQACQAISKYSVETARSAPTSPTLTKTRRASFGPLEHHFHHQHLSLHASLDKQFRAHVISGDSSGSGGGHSGPVSILLKPGNSAKEGNAEEYAIWVVKGEENEKWVMPYDSDNTDDIIDRHTHFDAHGHDLLDHVRQTLLNQLRQKRVVFTGHGGGGAMVSWVYQRILKESKDGGKDLAPHGMDLITFGSAATLWAEQRASLFKSTISENPSVGDIKKSFDAAKGNLCLAIVNKGDPVPRLSKDYVGWLASALKAGDSGDDSKTNEALKQTPWHSLMPFGQIVVLDESAKSAQWIDNETFKKTVWVDSSKNDIESYVKNVEAVCAK